MRRCNFCREDTETEEEDCVKCGLSKPYRENVMVLSERDWNKLMEHMENPPEPTEAFKKAMKEYKKKYEKKK